MLLYKGGDNLSVNKRPRAHAKRGPCSIVDEQVVGADAFDMFSFTAIDFPARTPM